MTEAKPTSEKQDNENVQLVITSEIYVSLGLLGVESNKTKGAVGALIQILRAFESEVRKRKSG
jgi:hypothetical protein